MELLLRIDRRRLAAHHAVIARDHSQHVLRLFLLQLSLSLSVPLFRRLCSRILTSLTGRRVSIGLSRRRRLRSGSLLRHGRLILQGCSKSPQPQPASHCPGASERPATGEAETLPVRGCWAATQRGKARTAVQKNKNLVTVQVYLSTFPDRRRWAAVVYRSRQKEA